MLGMRVFLSSAMPTAIDSFRTGANHTTEISSRGRPFPVRLNCAMGRESDRSTRAEFWFGK